MNRASTSVPTHATVASPGVGVGDVPPGAIPGPASLELGDARDGRGDSERRHTHTARSGASPASNRTVVRSGEHLADSHCRSACGGSAEQSPSIARRGFASASGPNHVVGAAGQVGRQPSPRARISKRLLRELAQRGLRHLGSLLLVLAAEAEGNACEITQAELAEMLCCDVRTVRRHEALLEQLGILRVVRSGRGNRRMVVLERLDAQLQPRIPSLADESSDRAADPNLTGRQASEQLDLFHNLPTASPQVAAACGHPCPVSSARETGHETGVHIRLARDARARAEEPLSDSSARRPAAAPWSAWRSRDAVTVAARRACNVPEWKSPSTEVDRIVLEWHTRLAMWPNTLRDVVTAGRDHCLKHGEARTLRYVDALARHCLLNRKNPAGSFLNGMRKWTARREGAAAAKRQHVLEDVGPAKSIGNVLANVLPREVRHA